MEREIGEIGIGSERRTTQGITFARPFPDS